LLAEGHTGGRALGDPGLVANAESLHAGQGDEASPARGDTGACRV
jgi:hypothetical protein